MLLLYKYGLILVVLLNINEIRSRTLRDLDGDLTVTNGTSIRSPGAVTEGGLGHSFGASALSEGGQPYTVGPGAVNEGVQVKKANEKRARDSEEENDEEEDDDEEEEVEDDESGDEEESNEPSVKAAELDEDYMKNHDMVDTHMTELYNEVVGSKKKTKGSSKDGGTKYDEKPSDEEKDKVEYGKDKEKDQHHGEKSPSKKKKKGGFKEKILPLLIIPYAIQMVVIPLVLMKLKMIALKAMAIGKLAILVILFNYFKYQYNAKTSHVDDQYIHDNQLMSEHYGYSGTPEVGAWVNGRSMEQFSRRRR